MRADQLFLLWDRVIGFDSTEIFAVLAAAIFKFREKLLCNARTLDDVQLLFEDISHLHVIPIIQEFLWPSSGSDEACRDGRRIG